MTYRQLQEELQKLPPERLDDTVTIYDPDVDEFCGVAYTETANSINNDVLDNGHFYLVLNSCSI